MTLLFCYFQGILLPQCVGVRRPLFLPKISLERRKIYVEEFILAGALHNPGMRNCPENPV